MLSRRRKSKKQAEQFNSRNINNNNVRLKFLIPSIYDINLVVMYDFQCNPPEPQDTLYLPLLTRHTRILMMI